MKFALFRGCKIPSFLPQYEISTRLVCSSLGVDLVDLEFNCCGYPVRHLDFYSFLFSTAKNLALAEKANLNVVTPCKCCYGSLKRAQHILARHEDLRHRVKEDLAEEGLEYRRGLRISHLLQVLYHDVGLEAIRSSISRPLEGPRIAVHYGCRALRPSNVTAFDNPYHPVKFDQLVEATGAVSVRWQRRLQCCGNPLWEKNNELSKLLMGKKLDDARGAGADFICVACTYCQLQFDVVQRILLDEQQQRQPLPSILYPQLLGLSMGFSAEELGMGAHILDARGIAVGLKVPAAA